MHITLYESIARYAPVYEISQLKSETSFAMAHSVISVEGVSQADWCVEKAVYSLPIMRKLLLSKTTNFYGNWPEYTFSSHCPTPRGHHGWISKGRSAGM